MRSFLFLFFLFFFSINAQANSLVDINKLGYILEVMTSVYAYGIAAGEEDGEGVIQLTKVLASSQIVVEGFKAMKLEKRPNGLNWRSFPSGHAAGAFSGAFFVHKRYGLKKAIIPYTMAFVTGVHRIVVNAHYPHDVLAGALIAGIATEIFVNKYLPKDVSLDTGAQGISLRYVKHF